MTSGIENEITISHQKYSFIEKDLDQSVLKFFPQNPRIYSLLDPDEVNPDQREIEEKLIDMDHVRELKVSIETNGGLIDPLIVRDGDFVVLEGNSRLAAYRLLAKKDPIKWGLIKCRLLPANIDDSAIFVLLGQYHIVGRKDWNPFEQAGYLWRRINGTNIKPETLATEMGLSKTKTKKMIEVYEFMKQHNSIDPSRWSYYEEYLKSRSINAARAEFSELDNVIVNQIKTGNIRQAIDIRQKLEPVTKIKNLKKRRKLISDFIAGNLSIDDCYEEACNCGVNKDIVKNLSTIRIKLINLDEDKYIPNLSQEERNKCQFEVKKILQITKNIEKKFTCAP